MNTKLGSFWVMLCLVSLATTLSCRADPGVTSNAILVGQSAALSGPAQELGIALRDGAKAYFDYINANGGVQGRKIIFTTLDDGYEPARAAANTKQLIEQDSVFALFGYVGTPTSIASIPAVEQANIPFFAPFTGAQSLREPFNRNIFHIRASYFEETESIVNSLTQSGVTKIAVLYQNDAYGAAGLEGVTRALKKHNLALAGSATVERNTVDVGAAVTKIKASGPGAVILVAAYKSVAAFIVEMRKQNANPFFWNISFVGSQTLVRELGSNAKGVMVSQVMPAPWDDVNPVVKEYMKLYVQGGKHPFDYVSIEGFVAAKVFVEGLRHSGQPPTREGLIKSLESMKNYDAGGFFVKFGPNHHTGSDYVDLTIISSDGRFVH
ncbi:MAG TPA: ABC transporter substrate-binding protein [Burkholderiaceae bacterium]|nr:ABC transporter substrate-binding protein [Burkholderiaceae bacterium]